MEEIKCLYKRCRILLWQWVVRTQCNKDDNVKNISNKILYFKRVKAIYHKHILKLSVNVYDSI